jgi:hypothetical protein
MSPVKHLPSSKIKKKKVSILKSDVLTINSQGIKRHAIALIVWELDIRSIFFLSEAFDLATQKAEIRKISLKPAQPNNSQDPSSKIPNAGMS